MYVQKYKRTEVDRNPKIGGPVVSLFSTGEKYHVYVFSRTNIFQRILRYQNKHNEKYLKQKVV